MIVLVVTPEEGGQIRDLLPAGPLKDYIAGYVAVELIPAPIPELILWRPGWRADGSGDGESRSIYDEDAARRIWDALTATGREKIPA